MLGAFSHLIEICWDMLGVVGSNLSQYPTCRNKVAKDVQQFGSIMLLQYVVGKCYYPTAVNIIQITVLICNSNWSEWSTIKGSNHASNFKIGRARSARPI